jgi:hypothetical protein
MSESKLTESQIRARLLAEALEKIATKSPDGTGKPRPIWSQDEMVKIARAALSECSE